MKRFLILFVVLIAALLGAGCGSDEKNADTGKKPEEKKSEAAAEAVAPNQTFKEIEFTNINWIMGAPDPEPTGGIWLWNKDRHPAGLDDQDWDHEDMLYVQASKKYQHQNINIEKLQVIDQDVVKIVVSWEKDIGREAPARDWVSVETGALDGKKFIVEDMEGKKVETQ
ncbi:hypothetical protein [Lihuaxuella thermophila]|uniref:hypothetical protein n=1 Tax=Lihuaxuella thermophila TaxID=1173111 RepID=UPI00111465C5|nr:hypothetical protein [Lihuaxuella thermophila]